MTPSHGYMSDFYRKQSSCCGEKVGKCTRPASAMRTEETSTTRSVLMRRHLPEEKHPDSGGLHEIPYICPHFKKPNAVYAVYYVIVQ